MAKLSTYLFLALILGVLFLSLAPSVRADDDAVADDDVDVADEEDKAHGDADEVEIDDETAESDEVEEPRQYYLGPNPDVQTTVYFPDFPDRKLVQGEDVTVLIGLTNTGSKEFNVSYVGESLHSLFDYTYYIQNFTAKFADAILHPKSELTVEYKFKPDINLEPLEFHLSGFVFYNVSKIEEPFVHTWINGTVELIEKKQGFSVQSAFNYVLVIAAVAGAAFFALNRKPKKSSREQGTRRAAADTWEATIYTPATKSKAAGVKSRRSNKKTTAQ